MSNISDKFHAFIEVIQLDGTYKYVQMFHLKQHKLHSKQLFPPQPFPCTSKTVKF